ncbi:MAG: CoA transferase [Dehalococcoidia bacterium]|nr:MAG: CoA transferase [Dehalococcoidia bacterium]
MSDGPLRGIRVLEFSVIVAAPFCGCILSDLGADVVKVEALGGDPHRNMGAIIPGLGKRFQSLNRGKRSLAVDLSTPEGREVIYRLVPDFDVVTVNYRIGVPERLGIDYESLRKHNPKLIYCQISGFGSGGPLKNRAGTDIVGVAYSGLMVGEAKVDGNGLPLGITSSSVADYCAGFAAAAAINAALVNRERTGVGQKIETSLLRAALAIQDTAVMREPVSDAASRDPMVEEIRRLRANRAPYTDIIEARSRGRGQRAALKGYYGGYQTGDGQFIVLGALTPATRNAARRVMGITDDLSDTPDFDAMDPKNIAAGEARWERIRELMLTRTLDEWVQDFEAAGVPCSPVNIPEEMSEDPQVVALGMMTELVHPLTGPQQVVGPVAVMSETPVQIQGPAPVVGGDTVAVLREHGLTDQEIGALVAQKAIGVASD